MDFFVVEMKDAKWVLGRGSVEFVRFWKEKILASVLPPTHSFSTSLDPKHKTKVSNSSRSYVDNPIDWILYEINGTRFSITEIVGLKFPKRNILITIEQCKLAT